MLLLPRPCLLFVWTCSLYAIAARTNNLQTRSCCVTTTPRAHTRHAAARARTRDKWGRDSACTTTLCARSGACNEQLRCERCSDAAFRRRARMCGGQRRPRTAAQPHDGTNRWRGSHANTRVGNTECTQAVDGPRGRDGHHKRGCACGRTGNRVASSCCQVGGGRRALRTHAAAILGTCRASTLGACVWSDAH